MCLNREDPNLKMNMVAGRMTLPHSRAEVATSGALSLKGHIPFHFLRVPLFLIYNGLEFLSYFGEN